MEEPHGSLYSIHLGSTKMYRDLQEVYWWDDLKKAIAEFVAKHQNCQKVMTEHQKTDGLTIVMNIPNLKWEEINMDFVVGFS